MNGVANVMTCVMRADSYYLDVVDVTSGTSPWVSAGEIAACRHFVGMITGALSCQRARILVSSVRHAAAADREKCVKGMHESAM
jgi:hypothetical protein